MFNVNYSTFNVMLVMDCRLAILTNKLIKSQATISKFFFLRGGVEKNGCLAVKPKSIKLTYAETVRLKDTVEAQNRLIANGYDPTNVSTTNDLFTDDEVKVDIKTK